MTLLFACSLCTSVATAETVEYWDPVGEGCVAVAVKAIPGLKYTLKRTDSLRRAEGVAPYQDWGAVGEQVVAEATTVTLTDGDPPTDQAFYRIVVSVP